MLRQDAYEVCGVFSGGVLIYDGEPDKSFGDVVFGEFALQNAQLRVHSFSPFCFIGYLLQQNKTLCDCDLTATISQKRAVKARA